LPARRPISRKVTEQSLRHRRIAAQMAVEVGMGRAHPGRTPAGPGNPPAAGAEFWAAPPAVVA